MSLILPLLILLIFAILIADWNYDHYADQRKRFKGYRNVVTEPFIMKNIHCPSNSGKPTFIKRFLWSI